MYSQEKVRRDFLSSGSSPYKLNPAKTAAERIMGKVTLFLNFLFVPIFLKEAI